MEKSPEQNEPLFENDTIPVDVNVAIANERNRLIQSWRDGGTENRMQWKLPDNYVCCFGILFMK